MGFNKFLELIKKGEPVSPGVANRPLITLDDNVNYIWEIIQAAALGSTVYARQVTIEAEAEIGMPLYFNSTRKRFERGLAQVDALSQGVLRTADSAQIWGIVAIKHNSTLADLLLFGLDDIDITQALGGAALTAGTYYLSGVTPGRLVKQRPPVSVPVLRSDGNGKVFVTPQFVDFLDRHTHYKFDLVCLPAGSHTPPTPGDRHVITSPDADSPGWLPASHASFNGHAPPLAAFGYNMAAHPELENAWPPLPAESGYVEWDKGESADEGFHGVPMGADGLVIINRYGIWWMSDCYGDVPWPKDLILPSSESASVSASQSQPECPRELKMALRVWFSKVLFATDETVVTSLVSKDARVIVKHADGSAGFAGDLVILLDFNLIVDPDNDKRGYFAFKTLEDGTFHRGPVVEGLYTTMDNVHLSGPASSQVNPGDVNSPVMYHGPVQITVDPGPTQELDVQLTRLDNAVQEHFADIMYLGFLAGQESSYRAVIMIPADNLFDTPVLQLRLVIMGRSAGALPALTVTARRVPRPTDGLVDLMNLPLAGDEFSVTITTTATLAAANQYVEALSTAFTVAAGDMVFFTVKRLASDGYAGEVGILQHVGVLSNS